MALMGGFMNENEQIITKLERGTLVMKFYPKRRPERKTLAIRRETRQILWSKDSIRAWRNIDGAGIYFGIFHFLFQTNKLFKKTKRKKLIKII